MNRRRDLLILFGAAALAPRVPLAQTRPAAGKVWRIGFLGVASASGYVAEVEAIRTGLRELGYLEGRNVSIDYRWADSDPHRLARFAAELVRLRADVIVTHGIPGVRAAREATATIPIVMADAGDPIAAGLVTSLSRPGGNITGSTSLQSEIHVKRLELLKEVFPRIKRVAALINALNPNMAVYVGHMKTAAQAMKVELHEIAVGEPGEFAGAFAVMARKKIEAAVIAEDPLLNSNTGALALLAEKQRLPAAGFTNFAEAGGLLAYGANRFEVFRRTAYFVDRIFKGAKPADIPIEQATKFELIVNAKTAKALGIAIPQSVLVRADRVIE